MNEWDKILVTDDKIYWRWMIQIIEDGILKLFIRFIEDEWLRLSIRFIEDEWFKLLRMEY